MHFRIQELYIQQTKKSKQSGQKKEKDKESGTPGSLTEIREKETGTPSSFTQGEEDVQVCQFLNILNMLGLLAACLIYF